MPTQIEIEVFNIGRTMVDQSEVARWMERLGVSEDASTDIRSGGISDSALLIALAAKRCYMSFEPGLNKNVNRIRRDMVKYFDNILASGHGSVLEHAVYSYAIEGLSRVATAELNRHRAGWAISEGSLRFIRFDQNIPYWLPLSLRPDETDNRDLAQRKYETRMIFDMVFKDAERFYGALMDIWKMDESDKNFDYKKKVTSCLRRIIPLGVATGGVWTGNIRALRHVLAVRTDPSAEEEIAHVFWKVGTDIIGRERMLFQDFSLGPNLSLVPKHRKV
jgi:thymidylate synthase (FAD)